MRLDEARGGELDELRFRELRIEGPVEVGERLDGDDAGLFEPSRKEAIGAAASSSSTSNSRNSRCASGAASACATRAGRASTMPDKRMVTTASRALSCSRRRSSISTLQRKG